jgi:hypothetical protein
MRGNHCVTAAGEALGRGFNPRPPLPVYNNPCESLTNALYHPPINHLYYVVPF